MNEQLQQEAMTWPAKAKSITIVNQESYDSAAGLLLGIKDLRAKINESYDPVIAAAHNSHKAAIEAKKKIESPLIEAEGIIKSSIRRWEQEQERIRLEAERKAREEAARIEEELRLQQAAAAEEEGAPDEIVDQMLDTPLPIPAPVIAPTFQRASGISAKKVWKWEIVDAAKIPRQYLMVNETMIGGIVRSMKGATSIPGIRVFEDTAIAAGRR